MPTFGLSNGLRTARSLCYGLGLCLLSILAHSAEVPDIRVRVEQRGERFIVDAQGELPVRPETAWDVLTDFERMPTIMNNLSESRIVSRSGNTLTLLQRGTARYGMFSYQFESVREIVLEPRQRILSRQTSGRAKSFASVAEITPSKEGTTLRYHAEIEPDGKIARLFGRPFVQDEIDEQLTLMAGEMLRREGKSMTRPNPERAIEK